MYSYDDKAKHGYLFGLADHGRRAPTDFPAYSIRYPFVISDSNTYTFPISYHHGVTFFFLY